MGHREVFVHVGDNVRVSAPNGRQVAPLITGKQKFSLKLDSYSRKFRDSIGTFGSSDFIHSLLGGMFNSRYLSALLLTIESVDRGNRPYRA